MLNANVRPGEVVAVVGAGPIGLPAMPTARLFSPARVVAIDLADARLEATERLGADVTIDNGREQGCAGAVRVPPATGPASSHRGATSATMRIR